ncbi:MAG: hypothetical protein R3C56_12150 [Pirellulaceae bacterium]
MGRDLRRKKDEPVSYLFETPLRLPPPDRVTSDEEAQSLVVAILAQLALLSVAVDVCEHYTPQQTYRIDDRDSPTAKNFVPTWPPTAVQHLFHQRPLRRAKRLRCRSTTPIS